MERIDHLLAHVWMVRTFLKHSEETAEEEDLLRVYRTLYDYMLALGKPWRDRNAVAYLKQAHKKHAKLQLAERQFSALQPDVSTHTNFQMAVKSLRVAVAEIGQILSNTSTYGDLPSSP